jgi:XRE family transcriptional regulator, fatty acid utilization regulator
MADSRPLYLGPRLKRLRRELGLTQQVMAEDLAISPSYVALLERNQRPLTADLLLRLAKSYRLDVTELAGEDSGEQAQRLTDMLRDPIFADIDLPPLEVADIAANFPSISEALLPLSGQSWQSLRQSGCQGRISGGGIGRCGRRRNMAARQGHPGAFSTR